MPRKQQSKRREHFGQIDKQRSGRYRARYLDPTDKTRFIWDGLRTQRLDRPYVRKDGRLQAASWQEAFGAIRNAVSGVAGDKIGAIAGDLASVEEMFALKDLLSKKW